jgi:hypothetical protein
MNQVKHGNRPTTSRLACSREEELLAVARVSGAEIGER